MTWDEISTKALADCGRCCCLCRRFKPIRLQVHHIVPKSEGGEDELDNAIALCLTCHTDVHTKAPFTRRFTVEELKMHRDNVYRLVAHGKLPAGEDTGSMFEQLSGPVAEAVSRSLRRDARPNLTPAAIRILVAAASADGQILLVRALEGDYVHVGGKTLVEDATNPRAFAEYKHALDELERDGFIEGRGNEDLRSFEVTHAGYLFADALQAEGEHVFEQ